MKDSVATEIRQQSIASARDLIAALDAELLALYPEDGTDQHFHLDADEVADAQGAFLVAYVAGEAVGCGALRMLDATTAEIKRMYVRPAMRGTGVGRALLESLEGRARAPGCEETRSRNRAEAACGDSPVFSGRLRPHRRLWELRSVTAEHVHG